MSKTSIHFEEYPEAQTCAIYVKTKSGTDYHICDILGIFDGEENGHEVYTYDVEWSYRALKNKHDFETMELAKKWAKETFIGKVMNWFTPVPYQVAFIAEPE